MAIPQAAVPQYLVQQPDILGNYAKMVSLKNMLAQSKEIPLDLQIKQQQLDQTKALAPAQQQQATAAASSAASKAALDAIALKSQQAQLAYWTNPDQFDSGPSESAQNDYRVERMLGIDPSDPLAATVRGQMKAGVDPNTAFADAKNILDFRSSNAKLSQDQQGALKTATDNLDKITAPIVAETDPQKRAEMLANAKPQLAAWAQTVSGVAPHMGQVVAQLNPDNIEAFSNYIGAEGDALDFQIKQAQSAVTGVPKTQQEAAGQLAVADYNFRTDPSDANKSALNKAQAAYDHITKTVQDERTFSENLQLKNNEANKELSLQNNLVQKGVEDINKLWTDPQHGFGQVAAQAASTKEAIGQAKNGSQLAANLEPLMVALGVTSFAGVHRINQTDVNAAGQSVGSLYRRLNALLDKAGAGSVPTATLEEADGLIDSMVEAKYTQGLASTQQIAANAKIPAQNVNIPQRDNFGSLITLDKAGTGSAPNTNAKPDDKGAANLPTVAKGFTRIRTSDGNLHDLPSGNLAAAKKIDPNLQVVTQ